MGCFRTDADDVVLMASVSITVAVLTALLPQYAVVFFASAYLYLFAVLWLLEPLCEWRRYFSAVFAASGAASLVIYHYALSETARYAASGDRVIFGYTMSPEGYAAWMQFQIMFILLSAFATLVANAYALKKLKPTSDYPPLPASADGLGRSVECLALRTTYVAQSCMRRTTSCRG